MWGAVSLSGRPGVDEEQMLGLPQLSWGEVWGPHPGPFLAFLRHLLAAPWAGLWGSSP